MTHPPWERYNYYLANQLTSISIYISSHTHTHKFHNKKIKQGKEKSSISCCVLNLNIHKHTTITLWPTIHTNHEYYKKCSPQGPTREHTQPGYCFCGPMFSLIHSEEVCLQRKEKSPSVPFSPYQDFLLVTMASLPHKCPSGGGLQVTNKSFQSSLAHQSLLSAWEKKNNQQWPFISTYPDL